MIPGAPDPAELPAFPPGPPPAPPAPLVAELVTGSTPGKRLFGLEVVGADGRRPPAAQILKRNVLRVVDAFPCAYLVGFVTMVASPGKQRVGDMVAGTYVVEAEDDAPVMRARRTALLGALLVGMLAIGIVSAVARANADAPEDRLGAFSYDRDVVKVLDASMDAIFVRHDLAATNALMPLDAASQTMMADQLSKLDAYIGTYDGTYRVLSRTKQSVRVPSLGSGDTEVLDVRLDASFSKRRGDVQLVFAVVDGRVQLLQWHVV